MSGWPATVFPSASVNGKDAHRLSVCATAMRYDERSVSDAAALAESAAIASASPAIWKRDLNIGRVANKISVEKSIEQYHREHNERPTGCKIVSLSPD